MSSPSTTRVPARSLPLKVASTPVDEDGNEEDAVEIRDRSGSTNDGTPEEAHDPIGDVVLMTPNVGLSTTHSELRTGTHGFARIFPPSARQKAVSAGTSLATMITDERKRRQLPMSSLDKGRILDSTPRELRERFAVAEDTLSLHLKSALL